MNLLFGLISSLLLAETTAQQTNPDVKTCYEGRKQDYLTKETHLLTSEPFRIANVTGKAAVEFKNIISEEDLTELAILEGCISEFDPVNVQQREFGHGHEKKDSAYSGNHVTFLNGYYQEILPQFNLKLTKALNIAVEAAGWIEPVDLLGLRCVEILSYNPKGELRPHVDEGSLYTLAIALSDPESFTGGAFFIKDETKWRMGAETELQDILEAPGHVITPSRLGGTLFMSHLVHGVEPVSEGHRKMFVIEYWKHKDGKVGDKRRAAFFVRDYLGLSPVFGRILCYAILFLGLMVVKKIVAITAEIGARKQKEFDILFEENQKKKAT